MKYFINNILAGFVLIVVVAGVSKAQERTTDSLSVNQAIYLSLNHQPQLEELQAQVEAAKARLGQTKSNNYPQVDVEASASHIDPVPSFSLDPSEPPKNLEPQNPLDAHLAARQKIYDFGKTKSNIALARSKTLTAKQRINVKKWAISYFTVQTYYSVLYLKDQIKVEQQQIETLNQDLKLAQERFEDGSATKYDVLSVKVRIAEEKNKKADLEGKKQKQQVQLRNLFGWKPDRSIELSDSLNLERKSPAINPGKVDYSERPDLKVLKQKERVAKERFEQSAKGKRPTISAGATAGFKNGYIKNIDRMFANWSVGINVNVPLFNGFKTKHEKEAAKAQVSSVNAQQRQLKRKIDKQLRTAYVDVKTGLEKIETTDLQIKQAKEQLRLAKLRYRKGVITNTDLLSSETALAQARLQQATAQYHILINQYELKKAAGRRIWVKK